MNNQGELVEKFVKKLKTLVDIIDNLCQDNQIHKVAGLIKLFLNKTPYDAVEIIGPELVTEPVSGYILNGVSDQSIHVIKQLLCQSKTLKEHVDVKAVATVLELKWVSLTTSQKDDLMLEARKLQKIYALYAINS